MLKPSEFLKQHPTRAYGIEAIAKACGCNVVEVIRELASTQQEQRFSGGYPVELVAGMWQWRVKQ